MIQQTCPHCSREIRVADEYAGKKIKCPGCKEVLALPAASTAVRPAAPPKPAPERTAPPPVAKPRPAAEEDDDVAVITEAVDDDEGDDEDLDRKPRKRRQRKRASSSDWADCPNCDAPGDAKRVSFTWWGGALGPWMFTHVRCNDCGTCYNGKTGKSNNTAIAIYIGVTAVISLILFALAGIAAIMGR